MINYIHISNHIICQTENNYIYINKYFIYLFIQYLYRVFTLQKIYTKIKFLLSTRALVIKDKILKALKKSKIKKYIDKNKNSDKIS